MTNEGRGISSVQFVIFHWSFVILLFAKSFSAFRNGGSGRELYRNCGAQKMSKLARAAMVVSDGASKVGLFKIRPRLGAEIQLGVGGLPEQEVGQALFARRANDEIGVRNWIGHEGRGKAHLVDFLRMEIAGNHSSGQRPGCHDNLLPRTVVQRQAEVEASAGSCGF